MYCPNLEVIYWLIVAFCVLEKGNGTSPRTTDFLEKNIPESITQITDDNLKEIAAKEANFHHSSNAVRSNFQFYQTHSPTNSPAILAPSLTLDKTSSNPSLVPSELFFPSQSPTFTLDSTPLPTPSPTQIQYPEAEIPEDAAENGYYSYNPNDSEFGPGTPIFVPYEVNSTLTYNRMIYMDNKWLGVKNSPEYYYWKEALGEDAEDIINNDVPNECDSRFQSPVNVWANGAKCFEYHEIRSLPGDFAMYEHAFIEKQILPNKLRFKYWRRPPGTEEPDPPTVDLPYGWSGLADLLHIDVRIPSEHLIEGVRYPAEYQLWYYCDIRKRIIAISIMMDIHPDDIPNSHWEKALVEMEVKFLADEIECLEKRRRKLKSEEQWVRRMKNFIQAGVDSADFDLARPYKSYGSDTQTKLINGYSTILEEPDHMEKTFQHIRKVTIERSENTLFDGKNPKSKSNTQLKTPDHTQSKISATNNLRGLKNSEESFPKANSERWDPLHHELKRSPYFYGYYGSLTDPPCTERVSWRIFDTPALISKDQLHRMKNTLFNHVDGSCRRTSSHYKANSARPIQDQMGRPIWHCTSENFVPNSD